MDMVEPLQLPEVAGAAPPPEVEALPFLAFKLAAAVAAAATGALVVCFFPIVGGERIWIWI